MGEGSGITVSDGKNKIYRCRITSVGKTRIEAAIEDVEAAGSELPAQIFLFQGLPKSDKMEWIIQKAAELGVSEIIPVATKRTVVKLDEKKEQARCARWNAIARGAAEQSGRARVPEVKKPVSFSQALTYAAALDVKIIPYECARGMEETRALFGAVRPGQSVAVFIGPEGGFEPEEVALAQEAGFRPVSLGGRILRTETAGLYVLSVLGYLLDAQCAQTDRSIV